MVPFPLPEGKSDRLAREIHVRLRLHQDRRPPLDFAAPDLGAMSLATVSETMPPDQATYQPESHIVTGPGVTRPGISEPGHDPESRRAVGYSFSSSAFSRAVMTSGSF